MKKKRDDRKLDEMRTIKVQHVFIIGVREIIGPTPKKPVIMRDG